jgi:hypothetical protein
VLAQAGVVGADRLCRRDQAGHGASGAGLARRSAVPVGTLPNWEGDWGMPSLPSALRLAMS